jgi:RNase P protein component|tara:strand:- start:6858 stop:7163 length:306 start_codon:yes stop_codon:yes gene_type:complete
MELVKDDTIAVQEGDFVLVTRKIVEKYDAEEYLRHLEQMGQRHDILMEQAEDIDKLSKLWGSQKEAMEVVKRAQEEQAKKDIAADLEKERQKSENNNPTAG